MSVSNLGLYIKRKMGFSMPLSYKAGLFSPALLILLVAFILNFSLIFIISMSEGIDKLLIFLGSGSVRVEGEIDDFSLSLFYVKEAGALAFSEEESIPLMLKGVDFQTYFTRERKKLLNLDEFSDGGYLNPVILSRRCAALLSLEVSDRFTLLVYDDDLNRTRPLLCTLSAVFDSGYMEFDESLCYIALSSLSGDVYTEIIMEDSSLIDETVDYFSSIGYNAYDYRVLYKSIYDNVVFSVKVLYGVLTLLAILASFFAASISIRYIDRDKKDIALLYLSGLSGGEIRYIYSIITLLVVLISIILGIALALLFSLSLPYLLNFLSAMDYDALDAYLTSFSIRYPVVGMVGLNSVLALFSFISLLVGLRHLRKVHLISLFSAE